MRIRHTCGPLVLGVLVGLSVATAQTPPPLEGTKWVLRQLGERPVEGAVPGREPHLQLDSLGRRVSGLTACNRFSGTYTLEGDGLQFGPVTITRMACLDGPPIEGRFLGALKATATWQIEGHFLELYDEEGTRVARFEARGEAVR